ncbi:hypothetical protein QBZ16_004890 [Prototheca wickerhamii]|uniref:Adenosylmethionine-8-amino-7-oxononanoate aminotransferase n=1 Tax=Prototheca wickerhamii TaxID=3111 RepID=A0AAD9IF57_PROWI|nr:hypothetical protein QBZ16_004890 [Prototheca wickerhamii]
MSFFRIAIWRASRRPGSRSLATDAHIPLSYAAICVWGANTGVGKTLVSAGLAAAVARAETGFPADSDARTVASTCGGDLAVGPHAARLLPSGGGNPAYSSSSRLAKTLFAWRPAVSPHLAAAGAGEGVADAAVLRATLAELHAYEGRGPYLRGDCLALVETAGGVGSPGPEGLPQADTLRALRLPGLLVGDGRLGGISATLAAYEFLRARGHEVPFIVLAEQEPGTSAAVASLVGRGATQVLSLPPPPAAPTAPSAAGDALLVPATIDAALADWLQRTGSAFDQLRGEVLAQHRQRVEDLATSAQRAQRALWWPFYQHAAARQPVTVVEARHGERLLAFRAEAPDAELGDEGAELQPLYDACASWWTQGLNARAQGAVLRAVTAAAARYGHVILSGTVHTPALQLAEALLRLPGHDWAARVFYSDNGSTAVEVALKMAFRTYLSRKPDLAARAGVVKGDAPAGEAHSNLSPSIELGVIGLTEAYHGDTLGAMECVAPSPYNGPKQTVWYRGRGVFLDPPTVALEKGVWTLSPGKDARAAESKEGLPSPAGAFGSLAELFGPREVEQAYYRAAIETRLDALLDGAGLVPGRPVLQGSGGMRLIDPAYQRALVAACQARGVFTGFWRLGSPTAAHLLKISPDIACYAKLLTGGLVPLAVTLATAEVFDAFKGPSKLDALLHGHSYTGHPTGCAAALAALRCYTDATINPNARALQAAAAEAAPLSLWGENTMRELSHLPGVKRVSGLGTVVAVELEVPDAGYASNAAEGVLARLRARDVFARPLGNTVYLMCTPMTDEATIQDLINALREALLAETA